MGLFRKRICGICGTKIDIGVYYTISNPNTKEFCYYACETCRDNLNLARGAAIFPFNPQEAKKIIDDARQPNGLIERKVRCKSCDNLFCYTSKDLAKNALLKEKARIEGNMSIYSTVFDSTISGNQHDSLAANYQSQIVDYDKCPRCGSSDLEVLNKEAYEKYQAERRNPQPAANNANTSTSVTDELKKYKELLDIGVITQEEFDAKKKQLLGL